MSLRVLINGGGIAGNALAFWLCKAGHDVTVVERFPTLRATGLQLDLRAHGVEVVRRMGLQEAIRAKLAKERGMQVVDEKGKRWGYFPAQKEGSFTTEWEIMRGDLTQILYEASIGARYIFGTQVETFEDKGAEGVEVRLTDGKTDRYDLLVGADGVGSRIRKMLFDDPKAFRPLDDTYIAYFTCPKPIQPGEEYVASLFMSTNNRGVMTRRQTPDHLQIYLGGKTASQALKDARDVKEQKKAMTEYMQGAGGIIDEILEKLDDVDDFYLERLGLVKLDAWSRGRVVLLGDAAYCPSANTGMGTTSAVVGAYVLAGELARSGGKDGVNGALRAYEDKFRPFMNEVVKGIEEGGGGFSMPAASSSFGIAVINWSIWLISTLRINPSVFFKERKPKWDLPEYGI